MGKLEWQQSFKRARLASYRAGQTVMDERASRRTFMLLVEGVASYTVVDKQAGRGAGVRGCGVEAPSTSCAATPAMPCVQGKLLQQLEMHSGFCFDVGLLNVLGELPGGQAGQEAADRGGQAWPRARRRQCIHLALVNTVMLLGPSSACSQACTSRSKSTCTTV